MQPHQERLLKEQKQLAEKLSALETFIEGNPVFHTLHPDECADMKRQYEAMTKYNDVLCNRIKRIPPAADRTAPTLAEAMAVTDEQRGCSRFVKTGMIEQQSPKEAIIRRAKELRVAIDSVLQDVKAFGKDCLASPCIDAPHADGFEFFKDPQEVPANIKLSQRHLEDAVMRLGMCMKAIGAPNPYPQSYNSESTAVEPTADGLKL